MPTQPGLPEIQFNPWDAAFRADPYPHYKPLLGGPPRLLELFVPAAIVARYADAKAALHDHARLSNEHPPVAAMREQGPFKGAPTILTSDPPTHTRLRRLVSRDFTPRRIRDLEPRIRALTAELLNAAARRGRFDVMEDLANHLPVMVIAEVMGLAREQYQTFKLWSDAVVAVANTLPGKQLPEEFRAATEELHAYFAEEIRRRQRKPGPDLVSALVAHTDAEALSAEELLALLVLLLIAGNESTTNLIGNAMLALVRHPDHMSLLRERPELTPSAIEEALRYDGPIHAIYRYAKESINLGGTAIPTGTWCFILLAAANRDPAQFPLPEKFDVTREPNEHLGFGEGIHFCIGAPLARLESAIAIAAVLERFPRLRLANPDAEPEYKGSFSLRGLSALPMAID